MIYPVARERALAQWRAIKDATTEAMVQSALAIFILDYFVGVILH